MRVNVTQSNIYRSEYHRTLYDPHVIKMRSILYIFLRTKVNVLSSNHDNLCYAAVRHDITCMRFIILKYTALILKN